MRIGADTYFLVLLAKEDGHAQHLFKEIVEGKHEFFVSTISITEFATVLYRKGQSELVESMKAQLVSFPHVNIVSVDLDIASNAAKRKHSFGLSTCDAVILATALTENCDVFIAEDSDYAQVKEQGIIKIVKPEDLL